MLAPKALFALLMLAAAAVAAPVPMANDMGTVVNPTPNAGAALSQAAIMFFSKSLLATFLLLGVQVLGAAIPYPEPYPGPVDVLDTRSSGDDGALGRRTNTQDKDLFLQDGNKWTPVRPSGPTYAEKQQLEASGNAAKASRTKPATAREDQTTYDTTHLESAGNAAKANRGKNY
ncbi:hypothetical protein ANO11243_017390 [Dothideomycetidae sp. 11243]|nr:hypothetical protein ANO11243_017390 [fungal sp. No.11243]